MKLVSLILSFTTLVFSQLQVKKQDLIALYGDRGEQIYKQLSDYTTYNSSDIILGSLYSATSGAGLGFMESKNFGYEWKAIGYDSWLAKWYRKNTSGDGIFAKSFDFNKVNRTIDYTFDRLSYKKLERFYGDRWYSHIFVYLHNFIIKNTSATLIRNWTKYDRPLKDFEMWELDFNYIINKLFIDN